MIAQRQLVVAVRDDDEQPEPRQPCREMHEHVDRRYIGPVKILDDKHQRLLCRRLLEERRQLAHQALRSPRRVLLRELAAVSPYGRRSWRDVSQPRRSPSAENLRHVRIVRDQLLERFEDRQVRLGTGKPFGAPPSTDPAASFDLLQKAVDGCGLPDSRFTGHGDHPPWRADGTLERPPQRLELVHPTDHRRASIAAGESGDARRARRHVLLDPFHLRRESIAKPGHRRDELLAVLAERLSDDRDVASETRVFNEAVRPHRLEQLLLW